MEKDVIWVITTRQKTPTVHELQIILIVPWVMHEQKSPAKNYRNTVRNCRNWIHVLTEIQSPRDDNEGNTNGLKTLANIDAAAFWQVPIPKPKY